MKKAKWFLAVLVVAAGLVMLAGCGVGRVNEDLVGTWTLSTNPAYVTTFHADGTGTHTVSWGFGTTFNWGTRGNDIHWDYSGYRNMHTPFRLSNNNNHLYITVDGGEVFLYIRN